jgi:hypothetical protein
MQPLDLLRTEENNSSITDIVLRCGLLCGFSKLLISKELP